MGRRLNADRRPVYVPWRRDITDFFWDTNIPKVMGKGKAHLGKVDAILTNSHLDTKINMCILMKGMVQKLEHAGEIWEGDSKYTAENSTFDSS